MKALQSIIGLIIGTINSLLGAGGGLIAVPYLSKNGLKQKQAQATSMFIILPLTVLSILLYEQNGMTTFTDILPFLPGGIAGAVAGGMLYNKMPANALRALFSAFMLYAGVRMIIQ